MFHNKKRSPNSFFIYYFISCFWKNKILKNEQTIIQTNIAIIKIVVLFCVAPPPVIFEMKKGKSLDKLPDLKNIVSSRLTITFKTKLTIIEIAIAAPELFTIKLIRVKIEANAQSARIAIAVNFIISTKSSDFIEVFVNKITAIRPESTERIIKAIAKIKFQINFESTISGLLIPLDATFLIVPVLKSLPINIHTIIKNIKVVGFVIILY